MPFHGAIHKKYIDYGEAIRDFSLAINSKFATTPTNDVVWANHLLLPPYVAAFHGNPFELWCLSSLFVCFARRLVALDHVIVISGYVLVILVVEHHVQFG